MAPFQDAYVPNTHTNPALTTMPTISTHDLNTLTFTIAIHADKHKDQQLQNKNHVECVREREKEREKGRERDRER